MAYFEQFKLLDGVVLSQENISAIGPGSPIETTYYSSICFQFNSLLGDTVAGNVTAMVEASNDLINWDIVRVLGTSDLTMTDRLITAGDTYTLKVSHKYVRYNILTMSGTFSIIVIGRSSSGPSAADNIADAFNPDTPLNVKVQNKTDQFGALMLSDGVPYYMQGNNSYIFNLNGYSTFIIQTSGAQVAAFTQSIDGTNYSSCFIMPILGTTGNAGSSSLGVTTGAGFYAGPVLGQFLRVVITSAGTSATQPAQIAIVLKRDPLNNSYFNAGSGLHNISQIGGVATSTPGNAASGAMPISGASPDNILRRIQTDVGGRTTVSGAVPNMFTTSGTGIGLQNTPSSNTTLPHNGIGMMPHSYQLSGSMNVQDTSQFEGQNFVELLSQILLELRILNQQMYELPLRLTYSVSGSDSPEMYRNDPSFFNINS